MFKHIERTYCIVKSSDSRACYWMAFVVATVVVRKTTGSRNAVGMIISFSCAQRQLKLECQSVFQGKSRECQAQIESLSWTTCEQESDGVSAWRALLRHPTGSSDDDEQLGICGRSLRRNARASSWSPHPCLRLTRRVTLVQSIRRSKSICWTRRRSFLLAYGVHCFAKEVCVDCCAWPLESLDRHDPRHEPSPEEYCCSEQTCWACIQEVDWLPLSRHFLPWDLANHCRNRKRQRCKLQDELWKLGWKLG